MGFGTKDAVIPEGSGKVYKGINGGAHVVAIMDIEVFIAASGSKIVNLLVEDNNPVEEGYEYEGLLGKHTATHNYASLAMGSWFKEVDDSVKVAISKDFASIANATGTRAQVDLISADTIDEYLQKILPMLKGKYFCTIVQEREYLSDGKVKTTKNIKAMKADDTYITLAKPYPEYKVENNVITNGSWTMDFNPLYDIKKVAKPDSETPPPNDAPPPSLNDLPF